MPSKLLCELAPSRFFFFFCRQRSSFYFLIFIFLAVPGLSCSLQDLFCSWSMLIFGCGIQTLSCGVWDLVPWPGIEPGPHALGAKCLSHWTARELSLQSPILPLTSSHTALDFSEYICPLWCFSFLLFFLSFPPPFLSSSLPPLNIKSISSWQPVLIFSCPVINGHRLIH